jgi:hypothetical protein
MTANRLLAVLLCLALAAPGALGAKVKVERKSDGPSGGFGWFGPGISFIDYGALNEKLRGSLVTPDLNGMQWTFGGGGLAMANRVLIGGSGFGGEQTVTGGVGPDLIDVEFSGGQFDIGYAAVALKHLLIAPMLGIGGTSYDMTLTYGSGDGRFGDLFGGGGRQTKVDYAQFSLTPQLMIAIPVSFAGIILRGGAVISPAAAKWEFEDGGRITDGPAMSKLTPFVGLNVMLGGVEGGGKPKVKVIKKVEPRDQGDDLEDEDEPGDSDEGEDD